MQSKFTIPQVQSLENNTEKPMFHDFLNSILRFRLFYSHNSPCTLRACSPILGTDSTLKTHSPSFVTT